MKLTYFTKGGKIMGWATGDGANYQMREAEKKCEVQLIPKDAQKILKNTHQPYLDKGKLKFQKRLRVAVEEAKQNLKKKKDLTQDDIKKAIKLLL